MIFEKRKVPLMFFVGMVFLYFPFYYAQYSPNPMAVVLATILFALVYCSLFYTQPQALFPAGLVLPDWLYRRHEFLGQSAIFPLYLQPVQYAGLVL